MSFRNKVSGYIDSWLEKGIIDSKQKKLLLEDINQESSTNTWFKIISIIGALFIGMGVLLIIASNWEAIPKLAQLFLVLFMPVGSILGGYYLSFIKESYKKIGDSLIVLGAILIGASLALIGQIYNLDGTVGSLLIWWFVLSAPLTLFFKFRVLSTLSIGLLYAGISYFVFEDNLIRGDEHILYFYLILSLGITGVSLGIRKMVESSYSIILKTFEVVSLKVFLLTLLISTFEDDLYFFGESLVSGIFQNIIFLFVVMFIIWLANKSYNLVLRNSMFFWIGIYMIIKYFEWGGTYMQGGIFFVSFGFFLMFLVYLYIKMKKFLNK